MSKRFIVRFSICREGQKHSPHLFDTDNIETAVFWANLPDIVVLDRNYNLMPVVTIEGVYYG